MIKPTPGRVVHYYPNGKGPGNPPLAATIAFVHSDTMINIGYLDQNGGHRSATSVTLLQHEYETAPPWNSFAEWMPYQKQVAAGEIPPTQHAKG